MSRRPFFQVSLSSGLQEDMASGGHSPPRKSTLWTPTPCPSCVEATLPGLPWPLTEAALRASARTSGPPCQSAWAWVGWPSPQQDRPSPLPWGRTLCVHSRPKRDSRRLRPGFPASLASPSLGPRPLQPVWRPGCAALAGALRWPPLGLLHQGDFEVSHPRAVVTPSEGPFRERPWPQPLTAQARHWENSCTSLRGATVAAGWPAPWRP